MKNLLLLFFLGFTFHTFGQVNSVIPDEANTFYNRAMQVIKPEIKSIIEKNANKLKGRNVNIDSLAKELNKDKLLKNNNQHHLQAITVLIMVQVSKNADADLKNLVINMHKNADQKVEKETLATNEIAENKVANILANKSQIAENVSLVMKKLSGSQEMVIDQLK